MNIPIEHALSIIQGDVEDFIFGKMHEHNVSAGLMEKILESVLCQIRKMNSRDLEKLVMEMNKDGSVQGDSRGAGGFSESE